MPGSGTERALIASIAAHTSWGNTTDRSARTAPARRALEEKFLREADGDPVRAEHLRKAHFQRLALRSAQSRRKSRRAAEMAEELLAEAETADVELSKLAGGDRV